MYVQYFVRYPPKKALIRHRPARQPRLTGWLCGFDTTSSQSATCLQDLKTQERSVNSPKMNRIAIFEYSPIMFLLSFQSEKTRCSPRTGMLTRMLMAQMSKHMKMQSRRTLFWKSLFEQSCTFFPCHHTSAPYTVEYEEGRVLSVECGVWSV